MRLSLSEAGRLMGSTCQQARQLLAVAATKEGAPRAVTDAWLMLQDEDDEGMESPALQRQASHWRDWQRQQQQQYAEQLITRTQLQPLLIQLEARQERWAEQQMELEDLEERQLEQESQQIPQAQQLLAQQQADLEEQHSQLLAQQQQILVQEEARLRETRLAAPIPTPLEQLSGARLLAQVQQAQRAHQLQLMQRQQLRREQQFQEKERMKEGTAALAHAPSSAPPAPSAAPKARPKATPSSAPRSAPSQAFPSAPWASTRQ